MQSHLSCVLSARVEDGFVATTLSTPYSDSSAGETICLLTAYKPLLVATLSCLQEVCVPRDIYFPHTRAGDSASYGACRAVFKLGVFWYTRRVDKAGEREESVAAVCAYMYLLTYI